MASALVKGTRKIRVYPKDKEFLLGLIRQQRRAYNLAIGCFREADKGLIPYDHPDLQKTQLRKIIRDFVADECSERNVSPPISETPRCTMRQLVAPLQDPA
jgi:hypothetical protein